MLQDDHTVRGIQKPWPSVKVAGPLSHPRALCSFMCEKAVTIAHTLLIFFLHFKKKKHLIGIFQLIEVKCSWGVTLVFRAHWDCSIELSIAKDPSELLGWSPVVLSRLHNSHLRKLLLCIIVFSNSLCARYFKIEHNSLRSMYIFFK